MVCVGVGPRKLHEQVAQVLRPTGTTSPLHLHQLRLMAARGAPQDQLMEEVDVELSSPIAGLAMSVQYEASHFGMSLQDSSEGGPSSGQVLSAAPEAS